MTPFKLVLLIVFICVPLANFILSPILSDGNQFADDPETRVAAAGYAFAIWGVIFAGMLMFPIFLIIAKVPETSNLIRAMVGLIIAGLASIAFVPISIYYSSTVGWIDILAHLIPLIAAYISLRYFVAANPLKHWGRFSLFGPSMYLGWISAATVISTSLMATEQGITLADEMATTLSIIVLGALAAIAIGVTLSRDVIIGGTVAWALIAVGVKQTAFPTIQMTAWIAAGLIILAVLYQALIKRRPFYAM